MGHGRSAGMVESNAAMGHGRSGEAGGGGGGVDLWW